MAAQDFERALSAVTPRAVNDNKDVSPQRTRALQDLQSGNYTAAAIRLERLWQSEKDPQLLRHLALALYRSDRHEEAVEALREFQTRTAALERP